MSRTFLRVDFKKSKLVLLLKKLSSVVSLSIMLGGDPKKRSITNKEISLLLNAILIIWLGFRCTQGNIWRDRFDLRVTKKS